jgi:hypothetical protein
MTSAAVPIVKFSDEEIIFDGLALISKGGKIGTLTNEDALGIKLLCGGLSSTDRVTVSLIIGGERVSAELLKIDVKPKLYMRDGVIVLRERFKIRADITEKPINMSEAVALEAVTAYVERAAYDAYSITVWEHNTDVFGLGKLIRKHLGEIYDSYEKSPQVYRQNSIINIETETI